MRSLLFTVRSAEDAVGTYGGAVSLDPGDVRGPLNGPFSPSACSQ